MDTRIPKQKSDYRLEELDGELLLYHPAQTKTVYLNSTASLIWRLCDGNWTVAAMTELLKESFPEAADSVEQEIMMTLDQFTDHGAIEFQ